jgi:hypothetical protein
MTDGSDEHSLAGAMIEVHGVEATAVARDNARGAALAGQATRAKAWTTGGGPWPVQFLLKGRTSTTRSNIYFYLMAGCPSKSECATTATSNRLLLDAIRAELE